jgi:hypothetical protein
VQSLNKNERQQKVEEPDGKSVETRTLNLRKINDLLYKNNISKRLQPGFIDLTGSSGQGFVNENTKANLKVN